MNETNEHNPDDWPDIRKPGDQSARIAELERKLLIERGEVEASSRILKDQDEEIAELKRRVEELTEENVSLKDNQGMAEGYAYERGADDVRSGVQEVVTHPDVEGLFSDMDGMKPALRIRFYCDPGESEVGIHGWASWVLAEDQQGTILADVTSELSQLRAEVERLTKERDEIESYATALAGIDADRDRLTEENDNLRAQLAEREEDRKDLDWLIEHGVIELWDKDRGALRWSKGHGNAKHARAAIRAARAQPEDGK